MACWINGQRSQQWEPEPIRCKSSEGPRSPWLLPPPIVSLGGELPQDFRTRNRFLSSLWKADNSFNKYYVKTNIIQKEEVIWLLIK